MRQIMGCTQAAKSRRNLAHTSDREVWEQARKEKHPMRYRLYCQDGAYNLKCDRITLLAEMREAKPYMIERLPTERKSKDAGLTPVKGDDSLRFPEHLTAVTLLEVES